jgi:tetratricopeptide (TPR) repeat protein
MHAARHDRATFVGGEGAMQSSGVQPSGSAGPASPNSIDRAGPLELKALIERDVIAARRQIADALTRQPQSVNLHEAHIYSFLACSDMPMVVSEAQRALTRCVSPNLHLWLGVAHLRLGNNELALTALQNSARLLPSAAALEMVGRSLHRLGRIDEAIGVLEQIVRQPEAAGGHLYAAERGLLYALRDQGRWREAELVARNLFARFKAAPLRVASAMHHYDMVNPYHRWSLFVEKPALAHQLALWHRRHPDEPPFWPDSFNLPEDAAALARFRAGAPPDQIYIVKPTNLYGGQGIRLTRTPELLPGESAVVQRYIGDPYLIDGRKFHLRLYLMVSSADPVRAYVYGEGIVRLAPELYRTDDEGLGRPAIHVTNTALHTGHPELVVSDDPQAEDVGNVRSLSAVLARIAAAGIGRHVVWGNIRSLAQRLVAVVTESGVVGGQAAEHSRYAFSPALFGLDVLLDAAGRAWLLEFQLLPAMTGSPLVNRINGELFRTTFRMAVFPLLDDPDDDPGALADTPLRTRLEEAKEMVVRGRFERLEDPPR